MPPHKPLGGADGGFACSTTCFKNWTMGSHRTNGISPLPPLETRFMRVGSEPIRIHRGDIAAQKTELRC